MRILFVISLIILSGCTGTKNLTNSSTPEPAPEWTFSRPLNPTYYIGIGFANKNTYPTDYSLIAKKNALSDMSSEITIKI